MEIQVSCDNELNKLIKQGNTHAFEIIYDRYWKRLFSYAYKILDNAEVCEDIVQEIFISLWKNAATATILNLEAYLLQSVKYRIATHIRDFKFQKEHIDVLHTIQVPDTIDDVEYRETERSIIEQIDKLPPRCREIFMMSRFEHYSNTEIAQKLNLSIHTVEKQISNALKHLRSGLNMYNLTIFVIAMFL
ncbi:RNA polymerase sigma factor [Flavobacterium rhizosphaerae]|uniref:RNA polymerase sigma-70 factor n=1 Tax=Flavobacterium rhizosphaerae TaxID=3163298 RepID=A0ABW8Z075_9FLAO